MDKLSAINANTYQRLLLDAGVVYANYGLGSQRILGATRGGSTFTIEPEYRMMPADGAPGDVKGSERALRVKVKLTTNILEMTTDNLKMALPASVSSTAGGYDTITRSAQLTNADYLDNVALVIKKSGSSVPFILILKNCLALGNFEVAGSDDDEPVLAVEFTAHFDPSALGTEPWEIRNPAETGIYTLRYIAGSNGYLSGDAVQVVASGDDGTLVTAVANSGYTFAGWSDSVATAGRTDTNILANITVTATFVSE